MAHVQVVDRGELDPGEASLVPAARLADLAGASQINKKVMQDPQMNDPDMMKNMPFDMKRFSMGGFKVLVSF